MTSAGFRFKHQLHQLPSSCNCSETSIHFLRGYSTLTMHSLTFAIGSPRIRRAVTPATQGAFLPSMSLFAGMNVECLLTMDFRPHVRTSLEVRFKLLVLASTLNTHRYWNGISHASHGLGGGLCSHHRLGRIHILSVFHLHFSGLLHRRPLTDVICSPHPRGSPGSF